MDNIYVSPTEFASISGVSRQTLIFYEKNLMFKVIFTYAK